MSKWFYINFFLIILFIWKVSSGIWNVHILFGVIGFILFMFNWMRHAMFDTLRSNMPRKKKIKFAKISKRAVPIHRWTGTLALICIILHGSLIIYRFGFQPDNFKMMFGLMAGLMMCVVVISGWIRHLKTSLWKRIIHLSVAFTLFYLIFIHLALF